MGYTTQFQGRIEIVPPLNQAEIDFLTKFANTRRMDRRNGPYFVDGSGFMGQGEDADVINHNVPPAGQPGLWCKWVPTEDGTSLVWDEREKFYHSVEWMKYLIHHFLEQGAIAAAELPFLQANHRLNGSIMAQGEDMNDRWKLIVTDNVVTTVDLE